MNKSMATIALCLMACSGYATEVNWSCDNNVASGVVGPSGVYDNFAEMSTWQIYMYTGARPTTQLGNEFDPVTLQPLNGGHMLVDTSGNPVSMGTTVDLYRFDGIANSLGNFMFVQSNAEYVAPVPAAPNNIVGLTGSANIYTVIWDAPVGSTPTHYAIFDNVDHSLNTFGGISADASIPTVTYDTSGVTGGLVANGGDWVAVPEPATLALFGLGMLGMGVRKAFKR